MYKCPAMLMLPVGELWAGLCLELLASFPAEPHHLLLCVCSFPAHETQPRMLQRSDFNKHRSGEEHCIALLKEWLVGMRLLVTRGSCALCAHAQQVPAPRVPCACTRAHLLVS